MVTLARCGVAQSAALGWRHSEQPTRVCRSRDLLPEERADPSGPGQPALRVMPALHLHVPFLVVDRLFLSCRLGLSVQEG